MGGMDYGDDGQGLSTPRRWSNLLKEHSIKPITLTLAGDTGCLSDWSYTVHPFCDWVQIGYYMFGYHEFYQY
jgi:hypothetical protein